MRYLIHFAFIQHLFLFLFTLSKIESLLLTKQLYPAARTWAKFSIKWENLLQSEFKIDSPSNLITGLHVDREWNKAETKSNMKTLCRRHQRQTQLRFRIDSYRNPLLGRPRNKAISWTKGCPSAAKRTDAVGDSKVSSWRDEGPP